MSADHHDKNIFFLLKDNQNNVLAQGQLIPVNGIVFKGETFNIFGIGGIITNIKGKGYGRKIMFSVKNYLRLHHKTGVGFTSLSNFYEKCGYSVDKGAIKQFVHVIDDKKIINTESDRVCYLDSDDKFMEKVLKNPDQEVYLPRNPDW